METICQQSRENRAVAGSAMTVDDQYRERTLQIRAIGEIVAMIVIY
jgi:hypothetical protein